MTLTPREKEIVKRILAGQKYAAIAAELRISIGTVDFHARNIRRKTGLCSLVQVAVFFARHPQGIRS